MEEKFLVFLILLINQNICISSFNLSSINKNNKEECKKNLLLGAIEKYPWIKIKAFFISFIKANFKNCDCVIFYRNINEDTLNKLKSLGIITYEIPKQYEGMKINNVRYKVYQDYLIDKLDEYRMVFHSDIRDTFFQKDVFQFYKKKYSFIGIALEDRNFTNRNNELWMKKQYGNQIFEEIKNKTIICSGTIL